MMSHELILRELKGKLSKKIKLLADQNEFQKVLESNFDKLMTLQQGIKFEIPKPIQTTSFLEEMNKVRIISDLKKEGDEFTKKSSQEFIDSLLNLPVDVFNSNFKK